jgi:hypothetical protein
VEGEYCQRSVKREGGVEENEWSEGMRGQGGEGDSGGCGSRERKEGECMERDRLKGNRRGKGEQDRVGESCRLKVFNMGMYGSEDD